MTNAELYQRMKDRIENKPDELEGYKGKWVNLYFWEKITETGTGVYETEELARMAAEESVEENNSTLRDSESRGRVAVFIEGGVIHRYDSFLFHIQMPIGDK